MVRQREEALNASLSTEINKHSQIESIAEARASSGSIDVLANVANVPVAIEAKRLDNKTVKGALQEVTAQACSRVNDGDAKIAVVVLYPERLTAQELEAGKELRWTKAQLDEKGQPETADETALSTGSVTDLADWLTVLPAELDPTQATRILQHALTTAADRLSLSERQRLVSAFNIPIKHHQKGAIRVFLMVAAAVMFHARLQDHLETLDPSDYLPEEEARVWKPPIPPGVCEQSDDPVEAFSEAWQAILQVDYRPIFESALLALGTLKGQSPRFASAVKHVSLVALRIASRVPHLGHDLLGGIFHQVLDTARYDGSFYTTTAAATLLAGLAIREDERDWSDPDAIANMRICDPACGSGTLLMAAADRINSLHQRALTTSCRESDQEDQAILGKILIEDVLWGYDINLTATHLAATTLGLLSPSVDFTRMGLFHSRFGVDEEGTHLGSIDLLPTFTLKGSIEEETGTQLLLAEMSPYTHTQVEADEAQERASNPPAMDLVIMNPPFTRADLRHDQLGKRTEDKVKVAEKEKVAGHPYRDAAQLHSSDGLFLLLADHLAKQPAPPPPPRKQRERNFCRRSPGGGGNVSRSSGPSGVSSKPLSHRNYCRSSRPETYQPVWRDCHFGDVGSGPPPYSGA